DRLDGPALAAGDTGAVVVGERRLQLSEHLGPILLTKRVVVILRDDGAVDDLLQWQPDEAVVRVVEVGPRDGASVAAAGVAFRTLQREAIVVEGRRSGRVCVDTAREIAFFYRLCLVDAVAELLEVDRRIDSIAGTHVPVVA